MIIRDADGTSALIVRAFNFRVAGYFALNWLNLCTRLSKLQIQLRLQARGHYDWPVKRVRQVQCASAPSAKKRHLRSMLSCADVARTTVSCLFVKLGFGGAQSGIGVPPSWAPQSLVGVSCFALRG